MIVNVSNDVKSKSWYDVSRSFLRILEWHVTDAQMHLAEKQKESDLKINMSH